MPLVIGGAILGSSLLGGLFGNKAAKSAAKASERKPLDIPALIEQARVQDEKRLADSLRLEQQYAPENAALRGTVNQALQAQANASLTPRNYEQEFLAGLQGAATSLPEGSPVRVALDQLKLGTGLDAQTQAQVAQGALEGSTSGGFAGSAAGRGLVARDLGLSGLSLFKDRLNTALAAEQQAKANYLDTISLGRNASQQDRANLLGLAGLVEARGLPEAGLSGADIANLAAAESNASNQARADQAALKYQRQSQLINSLVGGVQGAAMLYGARTPSAGTTAGGVPGSTTNYGTLNTPVAGGGLQFGQFRRGYP